VCVCEGCGEKLTSNEILNSVDDDDDIYDDDAAADDG
jgi:hypothetical protein